MQLMEKESRIKRLPYGMQRKIAKALGVSDMAVSLVFRGKSTSRRIEVFIAEQLGITREEFIELRDQER